MASLWWNFRGICANPVGRGRVYWWTPPGGCGNPADGSGLEIQQRVTRKGYPEAPYRIFNRKTRTLYSAVYDWRSDACLAAEKLAADLATAGKPLTGFRPVPLAAGVAGVAAEVAQEPDPYEEAPDGVSSDLLDTLSGRLLDGLSKEGSCNE